MSQEKAHSRCRRSNGKDASGTLRLGDSFLASLVAVLLVSLLPTFVMMDPALLDPGNWASYGRLVGLLVGMTISLFLYRYFDFCPRCMAWGLLLLVILLGMAFAAGTAITLTPDITQWGVGLRGIPLLFVFLFLGLAIDEFPLKRPLPPNWGMKEWFHEFGVLFGEVGFSQVFALVLYLIVVFTLFEWRFTEWPISWRVVVVAPMILVPWMAMHGRYSESPEFEKARRIQRRKESP